LARRNNRASKCGALRPKWRLRFVSNPVYGFPGMNRSSDEVHCEGSSPVGPARIPLWKRVLDVACVLLTIPLLLPVALVIAVMIKIGSRGPVLFRQERVGYQGRRFVCLKFRTMFVGADAAVHQGHWNNLITSNVPMKKMDLHGDPRLIPGGRLLRVSGLDELPQIINVLWGEMSLVGPRPCIPYEYEKYLTWQRERFNTLPGLTGLWQVSGKNRTTFVEMMHLDIEYVRNKTLWLDLKIIAKTIPALIVQMYDMRNGQKSVERSGSAKVGPP